MWSFQSANRRSLVPRGSTPAELFIGSCFHHGVEAQALGFDPVLSAKAWQEDEVKKLAQEHAERFGTPLSMETRLSLKTSNDMAINILTNYFDRYGSSPLGEYDYLCPEVTVQLPFETSVGEILLVGTIDGVALNRETGKLALVEHKTYSQKPDTGHFRLDHQMTGYAAIFEALTGIEVEGVIYDGVAKKLPQIPKILKNGTVSREWIDTTEKVYVKALIEANQDPESAFYADFRERLRERDEQPQTPYFTRQFVTFTGASKRNWLENVSQILEDMAQPELPMYPNFAWTGCWDCRVQDLCDAVQTGNGDLDELIEERYRVGTYGTQLALRFLEPLQVQSLQEFVEATNIWKEEVLAQGKKTFVHTISELEGIHDGV